MERLFTIRMGPFFDGSDAANRSLVASDGGLGAKVKDNAQYNMQMGDLQAKARLASAGAMKEQAPDLTSKLVRDAATQAVLGMKTSARKSTFLAGFGETPALPTLGKQTLGGK